MKRLFTPDGAFHALCANNGAGQATDGVCIALDGDKLKPRENPASGGNGFGINEDGAGYTLTGVDRHGVAYGIDQQGGKGGANVTEGIAPTVLSDSHGTPHGVAYGYEHYEAGGVKTLRKEESPSLSAGYAGSGFNNCAVQAFENHATDARVVPTSSAPTQGATRNGNASNNNPLVVHKQTPFVKTSHASGKDGKGEKWEQCEVAGTRNAIEGGDGRNQECIVHAGLDGYNQQITGDVAPTISGAACDIHHIHGLVSTNSNGEDVAPTLSSCEYKMGQNQKDTGGGYVITRSLGIGRDVMECGKDAKFAPDIREEASPTLRARSTTGGGYASK